MSGRGDPWRLIGKGVLVAAVVLLTGWALRAQFSQTSMAIVWAAFRAQPLSHLIASAGLTGLSFACLAVYDLVGVRIVAPARVPTRIALLAGATSHAVSNTLGFHALTGSVVRAHLYLRWGLRKSEVAAVVSLAWLALGLGFITMFAAAELQRAIAAAQATASLWVGLSITAALLLCVAWLARGQREISVFGLRQPLPTAGTAMLLVGIGAAESAAAVGALYILLPADLAPPFSVFAVGCIAAVALGIVAHAPGGIGVFEAGITTMLAGAGRADLLAALLMYRAIYNLAPFVLSLVTLGLLSRPRRAAFNSTPGSG